MEQRLWGKAELAALSLINGATNSDWKGVSRKMTSRLAPIPAVADSFPSASATLSRSCCSGREIVYVGGA